MSGYPIQYAKVQPPPLREETLARHRLLDWLGQKIHQRIVLVLADAGYGKTTLLADFANRTRLRTLWYRLDEDDRDWISLLAHLVAAGREADPGFAPKTAALLGDTSLSGPTRDAVIDVFIRELQTVAPQGAILIFDDFHLVDDAPDAQLIAREIVAHAPERLSIVFASRRAPGIPMAKLRATGEVAELTTDDLRFDATETEQLFRDTYGRTLEPDVLADVAARTEGWAASLQLVHAALRDRTPGEIRGFVRGLTGADHDLYDYLAEEVVGDLPADLQAFLMRTSILQVVTPAFAEVVAGVDAPTAARLTAAAERAALLGRRARGPRDELRYHPLVRTFLEERFARDAGDDAVRELHRVVAAYAQSRDWRIAAHHLWAAGDRSEARDLIDAAAKAIIGRGEYLVAAPFLTDLPEAEARASFEVVLSRRDFKEGDVRRALERARRAVELDSGGDLAVVNLASHQMNSGDFESALELAHLLVSHGTDPSIKGIAAGILTIVRSSQDGKVADAIEEFQRLAREHHDAGYGHYEGISQLNLADAYRAGGEIDLSRQAASTAVDLLRSSSAGAELQIARALLAWSEAHAGDLPRARSELALALEANDSGRADVLSEAADLEAGYGSAMLADDYLTLLRATGGGAVGADLEPLAVLVAIRRGDASEAMRAALAMGQDLATSLVAHKSRRLALVAHAHVEAQSRDARASIARALDQSQRQGARYWTQYCEGLGALVGTTEDLNRHIRSSSRSMWIVSRLAESVSARLEDLGDDELGLVVDEARARPERWRSALRLLADRQQPDGTRGMRLLEQIGEIEDVARLRRVAHRFRGSPESHLGKGLARRLAPKVVVDDLGRVTIRIGTATVEGSSVRRKVLALLCFLVTRPRFSAARDEVMDALWPEVDPDDALNSLNQTVYFLRRVFEPRYKDDLSPGYVHHESDVLWLDSELVSSRSQSCMELIKRMGSDPAPDEVRALVEMYSAPFALDFAYEDWANGHRSALHTAYLQVVERAVADDTSSGHFERGINVARTALELAPDADHLELSLLRLYRLHGSHAAAAEQYEHYAAALRENLGIEPPTLESL